MSHKLFVAYFRIDAGRQGHFDRGLGAQHKAVAEYLDGGERELVGIFTEVESGGRGERPELARALEACRRQKATLIVATLDTVPRDANVLFPIFADAVDCEVVFCDPRQDSPFRSRKSLAARMASMTESEAATIGWRRRATWGTASVPGTGLGWVDSPLEDEQRATGRADAANRRLADQRAADILPVIRSIQASGVRTLQGLADALNARGVRTARGGRWYPTTVRNVLRRKMSGAQPANGDPEWFGGASSWRSESNERRPSILR